MVEFALILVPLLLILLGTLQFGIILNAKITGTQLSSSGARYAAVNQNPGAELDPALSLQEYIRSRAGTQAMRDNAKVCVEYPDGPVAGAPVRVSMSYTYDLIPLIGDRLGSGLDALTIVGDATMRLETEPADILEECVE